MDAFVKEKCREEKEKVFFIRLNSIDFINDHQQNNYTHHFTLFYVQMYVQESWESDHHRDKYRHGPQGTV